MNIEKLAKKKAELEKIKIETNNKFWNIGKKSIEIIQKIIEKNKFTSALEIGTSNGYSTLFLYEKIYENNGKLTTIESNKERYEIAKKNFIEAEIYDKIKFILGHSPEILNELNEKYDFVFLDCVKVDYLPTFIQLQNKVIKNWIVVCDNIISHHNELRDFFTYLKKNKYNYKIYNIENGIIEIKSPVEKIIRA